MTIPSEKAMSLKNTEAFLKYLLSGEYNSKTKSSYIKARAYRCLKHYPFDYEIEGFFESEIGEYNKMIGGEKSE